MDYLTLYLPLWVFKLPNNKPRSIYCNSIGIFITLSSVGGYIIWIEWSNSLLLSIMTSAYSVARIFHLYVYRYQFHYSWRHHFIDTNYAMQQRDTRLIDMTKTRMRFMSILFVIFAFWYNWFGNLSTLWTWMYLLCMNHSLLTCSIIFVKYELSLSIITNMIINNDDISVALEKYERCKKMFDFEYNNYKSWKMWLHLMLLLNLVNLWFEITNVLNPHGREGIFHFMIWLAGVLVFWLEFVIAAARVNRQYNMLEQEIESKMLQHAKEDHIAYGAICIFCIYKYLYMFIWFISI